MGNIKSQNLYTAELQTLSIALESLVVQRSSLSAVTVMKRSLSFDNWWNDANLCWWSSVLMEPEMRSRLAL